MTVAAEANKGPMVGVALDLAERGFRVLPLHTPTGGRCSCGRATCGRDAGKHPRITGWEEAASSDPGAVRGWWRRWPDANVGIKTGPGSGIVVVDVDPGRGGEETWRDLRAQYGPIPDSWVCLTGGGGQHYYYRHPGGEIHDCALGSGVELRADGGQVVGPGSLHRSGQRYLWEASSAPESVALASLPAPLVEALRPRTTTSCAAGHVPIDPNRPRVPFTILVRRALLMASETGRNNAGFWLACQLRDNGYAREEAREVAAEYAESVPPMADADGVIHDYGEREAQHSIDEAFKRPPRSPWAPLDDGADKRAQRPNAEPKTLADVVSVVRRWLYVDDLGALYAVLGSVAGNLLESDPVWLLVIGPPSGGKTEIINAILGLPNVHAVATITEAGLLSGTPKREAAGGSGGLLRSIGRFGLILCKDFTSILSLRPDARASVLAALREIYDGAWTRQVGSDGGRELAWTGKVGLVGGCTPIIDVHHAVIASMGDRFLFYRLPETDRRKQVARSLQNAGSEALMRAEIAAVVHGLFAGIAVPERIEPLEEADANRLGALADLVSRARSHVERDRFSREIELIPASEMPARIAQALRRLLAGLDAIGLEREEGWRVVGRVAIDCLPQLRRDILAYLHARAAPAGTNEVAADLDYPASTIRRGLEDLRAHRVLTRQGFGRETPASWWLSPWALDSIAEARIELTPSQPGQYGRRTTEEQG